MREIIRNIFLSFAGSIKRPKSGIHILNSHYVSPSAMNEKIDFIDFERYLSFLSKTCSFVKVEDAAKRLQEKDIPTNKVLVAFTFDDGFEECYTVIAPLLEKYNCRGAFFINANYIGSDIEYQKEFNVRTQTFTKKPMSWNQVIDLHKRGHLIGSHNLDHTNMAELNEKDLDEQLKKNKEILESKLNYNCEYFAWTYGQMQHFPERALEATAKYHKFIFSATNYKNYFSMDENVINRRHIEPFWPKNHIDYFLSVNKKA